MNSKKMKPQAGVALLNERDEKKTGRNQQKKAESLVTAKTFRFNTSDAAKSAPFFRSP